MLLDKSDCGCKLNRDWRTLNKKCFKAGIIGISILCWCLIVFSATPYIFAETSLDHIKSELKSCDLDLCLAAVEKLRHRTDEETVDLLIAVAGNRREAWEVQVKAIQLLGETKNPKAIALLVHIFDSHARDWECPAIKSYTAIALSNFGNKPGVTQALIRGLHDSELLTREASIKALGIVRDKNAIPHLVPLLEDKSIAVRLSVIKALEQIGDGRVIPVLKIVAEKDTDKVVRNTAKFALKNFRTR
jgi:HEAT repeat protein